MLMFSFVLCHVSLMYIESLDAYVSEREMVIHFDPLQQLKR